ncbi:glycosyl hydrolase family 28 protein [Paenibacillus mendelii]|uniref:Glycosyl hydrolase family 28 protein n=1 Tax=Paenibacillus mendelii TaxID=206163 RepID=A0ABV6JFJ6_9BACL|nr:glycosyl hydrolase family 28 protein [Paenibacillus mendelii]MCQ6557446.1 glycosyl hydrolase family 28 protein [Paenibacillus mendelii]
MKQLIRVVIMSILLQLMVGCSESSRIVGEVTAYAAPGDLPVHLRSTDFAVAAGGKEIDMYNGGYNSWNNPVTYGSFDMSGSVTVTITPSDAFETYKLVPRSLGIAGKRKGDSITFTLQEAANVTLVLDDNYQGKVLHLFAQTEETDIPDRTDPNVIFYEPGYHDLGGYGSAPIYLKSGQTLYIAGGAIVRGRIRANDVSNVTIRGRGILLNDYTANDEHGNITLALNFATHSMVRDIIVNNDTNNWTSAVHGSSFVEVLNYKGISPRFASSDGFDINSSHDITFDGSFIHSADDAVAIKGLSDEKEAAKALPIYNITYKNAQLWADANNAIGIGAETVAAYIKNIRFENIDILYNYDDRNNPDVLPDRSAINIFSLNATHFSDITFEDIRVEKAKRLINIQMDTTFYFGALLGNWVEDGSMSGITYKNITSYSDGTNEIKVAGWDDKHLISDVAFQNITINGKKVKNTKEPYFTINKYTKTINVR